MKLARVALSVLISAVFLLLAFHGVEFDKVGEALRRANYLWLVPGVIAIVIAILMRALRWRMLFHPQGGLRYSSVFGSLNVGYLVNDLLPLRLGEVVRAYLLAQQEPAVKVPHALSTVFVERVLDLVVTLAYLAVLLAFVDLPANSGPKIASVTALAVVALVVILIAGAMPQRTHQLARLFTRFLPRLFARRLHDTLDHFLQGFGVLSTPRVALPIVALSVLLWAMAAAAMWCVMFAFDIRLAPTAPLFVLALVSLSFVVPAAPGHVGVFHWTAVTALEPFNVAGEIALSYAFVAHLVTFTPPMVMGAAYLWRTGISFDRVFALRRGRGQSAGAVDHAVSAQQPSETDPATILVKR